MTVVAPLVAVIVTVSPSVAPLAPTVGVASFVSLSLEELPVSEEVSRSGVTGSNTRITFEVAFTVLSRLLSVSTAR